MPSDYKYRSTGSFRPNIPDVNGKGCLKNLLIVLITVAILVGLSYFFGWE